MENYRVSPDNLDDMIEEMVATARLTKSNVTRYIKTQVPAEFIYHAIVDYVESNEAMVLLPNKDNELLFRAMYKETH